MKVSQMVLTISLEQKNNQYLTNVKTIIPSFKEKDSQDSDTQKWIVTKDGGDAIKDNESG